MGKSKKELWDKQNNKRRVLLKNHGGTAQWRLRRAIIFYLAGKCGVLNCFRCGELITTADDMTIDHKVAWMSASDPIKEFYDMGNIAFSHRGCNLSAASDSRKKPDIDGTRWCWRCKAYLPIDKFPKCKGRNTGCIECRKIVKRKTADKRKASGIPYPPRTPRGPLTPPPSHCINGHPYTPDNLRFKKSDGSIRCATCHRDREIKRFYDKKNKTNGGVSNDHQIS